MSVRVTNCRLVWPLGMWNTSARTATAEAKRTAAIKPRTIVFSNMICLLINASLCLHICIHAISIQHYHTLTAFRPHNLHASTVPMPQSKLKAAINRRTPK